MILVADLDRLAQLFAPVLMMSGGLWLLWWHRKLIGTGWKSRRWHSAHARVIDSVDATFYITLGGSWRAKFPERDYTFEYRVKGKKFTTNNYIFGAHLDQTEAHFLIGQHVTIYYNPEDPADAVVRRGVAFTTCFGLVFVGAGLLWLILIWHGRVFI